jgi:hypothetical protein
MNILAHYRSHNASRNATENVYMYKHIQFTKIVILVIPEFRVETYAFDSRFPWISHNCTKITDFVDFADS